MTSEPLWLILVTLVAVVATEAITSVWRSLVRLMPGEVALVVIPMAIRIGFVAVVGITIFTGLVQLQHTLDLINSIVP